MRRRAEGLGIEHVHLGVKEKGPRLDALLATLGLQASEVAYMGDDLNDLPVLRRVGYPAAPADAQAEVLEAARFVASKPGGRGAARELVEHLLRAQDKWESIVASYGGP
jgi:3-deoxy-D-manno-octulosonate 8-phosphate phosphatase (KDO 8-P phosphatase)